MSIAFFSFGHSTYSTRPDPAMSTRSVVRSRWRDRLIAADVEHLAVAGVARPGPQKRISGIVDEHEVAALRSIAVDLNRPAFDGQPDEPADEALTIVTDQLTRAVDVREAQRTGADAEDVVVHEVVILASSLVDSVDVGGLDEVMFGDRQRVGPAVDLACPGKHHFHCGIVVAARFKDRQLTATVDLEIRIRISHAVDVADLPGEIENDVAILHQVVHRRLLPDVRDVHANAIGDAVDVEQIAAVVGNQRVDEQDVGAERDELVGEIAADEAEAAGDHHAAAPIELSVGHGHVRGELGPGTSPA